MAEHTPSGSGIDKETAPAAVGRRVFVSYRRRDSQGATGRLCDGLVAALGEDAVFRDVAALRPGVDFAKSIEDELATCPVLLAVIGPRWVDCLASFGSHPGDGPVDYVLLEIAAALRRGILVIPVLVDGAAMPLASELPAELVPLAKRQAHELSDKRWPYDLAQLVRHLAAHVGRSTMPPWPRPDRRVLVPALLATLALYASALLLPVQTAAPMIDLQATGLDVGWPSVAGAGDGGLVLAVGAAFAWLLRALLSKYQEVVASRFGTWLQDRHVFAVVTLGVLLGVPPIVVGRPLFAGAVLALTAAAVAARRPLAQALGHWRRAAMTAAMTLSFLGLALGADVWVDHRRQAGHDVALLLPPMGSGVAAEQVFLDFRSALRVSLAGTPVEVVPERLSQDDYDNLVIEKPQRLLAYKGPRGSARVFIRVQYTLASGQLSLVVWPYLRPAHLETGLAEPEGWAPPPLVGPVESREIALRAAFELIAFLADKSQLRLSASDRERVGRQMLGEYEQVLRLRRADCRTLIDAVASLRRQAQAPEVAALRRMLFAPCPGDVAPPPPQAAAADLQTARTLWGRTFGR